jgi:hypothetical protein
MTIMAWHDTFEAAFDVTSLLTSLFTGDWPVTAATVERRAWAAMAAGHARGWADVVALHPLPRLSAQQRRTLFHERVHYWQLMSLPLQQAGFLLDLERIKATAVAAGGTNPHISGVSYGEPLSAQELYQGYRSVQANFSTPALADIRTFDPSSTANVIPDRSAAMPFVMFPWGSAADQELLPAYMGMIGFDGTDDGAFVPFSGRNLLESAAYLSERLRDGRLPEPLGPSSSESDVTYLGAWQFWVRVHGHRYRGEKDLALGFLTAVDLAMCSDFDPDDFGRGDDEERAVWTSIPYRFGKIVYRLQGQDPLVAAGSASTAIGTFQADFCRWCGLPAPEVIVHKAMARLTKALALHMAPGTLTAHFDQVSAVVRLQDWDLASRPAEYEALWPLISADLADSPAIGQVIMWTMLSALRLRLRHPGMFAAPHLYERELSALFPLPLLCRDGMYYLDAEAPPAPAADGDLRSDPVQLLHDCLSLMTTSPLRSGTVQCGFLTKAVQCWYQHCGLGCPVDGLEPEQARIRHGTGLGDWCHWEQRRLRLSLP